MSPMGSDTYLWETFPHEFRTFVWTTIFKVLIEYPDKDDIAFAADVGIALEDYVWREKRMPTEAQFETIARNAAVLTPYQQKKRKKGEPAR